VIENHSIIGDLHTVALVLILSDAGKGSVDRLLSAQLEVQRASQN
jgi:hypothetical protein